MDGLSTAYGLAAWLSLGGIDAAAAQMQCKFDVHECQPGLGHKCCLEVC